MANDFSIHIPPRDISGIEKSQTPGAGKKAAEQPNAGEFKDTLRQALGNISRQAETISNAAAPSYEDVQNVMNSAKDAFQQSMHAHLLMQDLIKDINPGDK